MTVVAARGHISADLAEEVIIFDLSAGKYYGLDGVGARVWGLIQEPRSISDLREALMSEFEVDADRCESDLMRLLGELESRGLIEREHARSRD